MGARNIWSRCVFLRLGFLWPAFSVTITVIVVAIVDTIDEAVELANASDYSMVASLWTKDINLAFDVAPRIRAGQ